MKNFFLTKSASSTDKGVSTVKDITFTLSLSGNYSQLESFIESLEKSARIFEITSISFGSSGQQSQQQTLVKQTSQQTSQQTLQSTNQFQTNQAYTFSLSIKTHSY